MKVPRTTTTKKTKDKWVTARLSEDLLKKLYALAAANDRTLSSQIVHILKNNL